MADDCKPFVSRVLALAGVEHTWLAEALVRARAHPAFDELFGSAPALDLALTEAAAREHPTATLCTPGSFAFDQLVRWARLLPGTFRTRLHVGAVREPPRPVANGELSVRMEQTEDRAFLFALFRVSLHSDELVERLVPLLFHGDGTPLPTRCGDLAARLEGREREPGSGRPVLLPGELLAAVEHEAERAARDLTREHLPAVEARKAQEIARLEAYLRSLRDELQGELPAGAARRAAQIKTQARARLDALRLLLPGDAPWDRDALLLLLQPGRRFGLSRRADPARHLDPEMRAGVVELLRRLPESFSFAEAETWVARDTEQRLERLEKRAREEQSPTAALAEREQQLEAEHRARVADIEEKFHLRVLAHPVLLEWLDAPALTHELTVTGSGCAELSAVWDTLTEAWEMPPCPSCGGSLETMWLCERSHIACQACASVCRRCSRARCRGCAFDPCAVCRAAACEQCGAKCDRCSAWGCDRHAVACPECRRTSCSRCGGACHACDAALCPEHRLTCAICSRATCAEHGLRCAICYRGACLDHGERCPCCSRPFCADHRAVCRFCRQACCTPCAGDGSRCATCLSLEPAGPGTVEALRTRLRDSAPAVDPTRFRTWWLGRNARFWIVVARRWPWNHVFVLKDESRAMVSHRRYWSWRGL